MSFNFRAAVSICSDFGAQENKICHFFHCFPIYLPWSDVTRSHFLVFWMLSFKPTFALSSFIFIKRVFQSSGPKLVHLPLANYKWSPLVVSSYFQNRQRSGHKEIKTILSEPEAQGVFYNLGKRFHGGKFRRKVERSPQQAGDESHGVPFFRSHGKLRKYLF